MNLPAQVHDQAMTVSKELLVRLPLLSECSFAVSKGACISQVLLSLLFQLARRKDLDLNLWKILHEQVRKILPHLHIILGNMFKPRFDQSHGGGNKALITNI